MKKTIILIAILLMSGFAYANDPNVVSVDNQIVVAVDANVMTIQIYLDEEAAYVYERSNITEIITSIKAVLQKRIRRFRAEWLQKKANETPTTEMD